jgi:hypothetical protein
MRSPFGEETTMQQLILELPDALAQQLTELANKHGKSVEQIALERLEAAVEPAEETLEERYERFFAESGLFVQVPDEVKRRHRPISEERLKELADKLGAAGPLSEVVIEDRADRF